MEMLLIDMDQVIADFKFDYEKSKLENPNIKYPQSQKHFFENLKPIKDSIESVNKLKEKYNIYFLTRPSILNPLCYTEKRLWIEKHFGIEMCKYLIICYDKTMVKGDYLIDDVIQSGDFQKDWKHIHFGNKEFNTWTKVLDHLM